MRKIRLLTTLIFSLTMFSSTSFAEWTGVSKSAHGTIWYVDFERIREHGGYVYFWYLSDYLKPSKFGTLSAKVYSQGDCKSFRYKDLGEFFHKEPMGGGSGESHTPSDEWNYPPPNTAGEHILKEVCEYSN